MRLTELLKNVCAPPFDAEIAGISCDSRKVEADFAFVCIDGVEVDGHKFAPSAVQNGATVLITQRDLGLPGQIIVPDTRAAWGVMSANWFGHPDARLRMIGVTGTNGKTSTTYMLKHVLEECGRKVGLIGTIQSMIGARPIPACHTTPEAYELQSLLAQMAGEGCDDVVMEVSSHALAQCRVEGMRFDAGIFTHGGYAHGYGDLAVKLIDGTFVHESDYAILRRVQAKREEPVCRFEFAYAITCHKAQGSEFDFVIVFDERYIFGEDRARWLYTAITRAKKKLLIIR